MKYSINMSIYTLIPLLMSLMLFYNNMFISLEIPLINTFSFYIPISILMDWISCLFISTVMFISSMIIMFSMFYIPYKEHKKFSLMLMMFVLSMGILIISDNIIFILLGWDGLGLSSYILVIYYQDFSSASSGTITLLSNRLGDIMILLSISIMMINSNWNFNMNKEFNTISLILILIAASSKSAQFPFSAWLPAAMAAPTPISALVHSSTLVTAGVFISIRIMNEIHPISMFIMMMSSSATALYSSMAANWEQDMKKIIALSTLSQIAMMMFAISMKSTLLAFFHLITHALFKSTMFLCAGIMIHNSTYQDMRMMGMNNKNNPLTISILGISSMALMGIPFMSGFFSKDSIIEMMLSSKIKCIMSMLMIISIGMTASYTLRMSMMSNNTQLKSKLDMNSHNSNSANIPILLMIPASIMIGNSLMWLMNLEQIFIYPIYIKWMIIISLLTGMMLGLILSFKSKNYIKKGESSISLWFIHFMTVYMTKPLNPLMKITANNDKMWQEMYGPQGSYFMNKKTSMLPYKIKLSMMLMLIMLLMIPIMISY